MDGHECHAVLIIGRTILVGHEGDLAEVGGEGRCLICFEGGTNIFIDPAEELLDVLYSAFALSGRVGL